MELAIVAAASAAASVMTLFSGFGLGTILLPVFVLFLPIPAAIAAVAIVHMTNNLFKLVLLGRHADRRIVVIFGGPALVAAFAGAATLGAMSDIPDLLTYSFLGHSFAIQPLKLVIGLLLMGFAGLEIWPTFAKWQFDRRWMAIGGLLSGFLGGLSGMQGALRSAFLSKAGLSKESFIATGTVCAVIVDVSRLAVYGAGFWSAAPDLLTTDAGPLAATATLAALLGVWIGKRLLTKITYQTVKMIVAAAIAGLGLSMACGWV